MTAILTSLPDMTCPLSKLYIRNLKTPRLRQGVLVTLAGSDLSRQVLRKLDFDICNE